MSRDWTPEGLKRRQEATERTRPWERSTGPKSAEGKARSSQNAIKHGYWCKQAIQARRAAKGLLRSLESSQVDCRSG